MVEIILFIVLMLVVGFVVSCLVYIFQTFSYRLHTKCRKCKTYYDFVRDISYRLGNISTVTTKSPIKNSRDDNGYRTITKQTVGFTCHCHNCGKITEWRRSYTIATFGGGRDNIYKIEDHIEMYRKIVERRYKRQNIEMTKNSLKKNIDKEEIVKGSQSIDISNQLYNEEQIQNNLINHNISKEQNLINNNAYDTSQPSAIVLNNKSKNIQLSTNSKSNYANQIATSNMEMNQQVEEYIRDINNSMYNNIFYDVDYGDDDKAIFDSSLNLFKKIVVIKHYLNTSTLANCIKEKENLMKNYNKLNYNKQQKYNLIADIFPEIQATIEPMYMNFCENSHFEKSELFLICKKDLLKSITEINNTISKVLDMCMINSLIVLDQRITNLGSYSDYNAFDKILIKTEISIKNTCSALPLTLRNKYEKIKEVVEEFSKLIELSNNLMKQIDDSDKKFEAIQNPLFNFRLLLFKTIKDSINKN